VILLPGFHLFARRNDALSFPEVGTPGNQAKHQSSSSSVISGINSQDITKIIVTVAKETDKVSAD
jgi:hypothetical protein